MVHYEPSDEQMALSGAERPGCGQFGAAVVTGPVTPRLALYLLLHQPPTTPSAARQWCDVGPDFSSRLPLVRSEELTHRFSKGDQVAASSLGLEIEKGFPRFA